MKFETRYDLGQTVWTVGKIKLSEWKSCFFCDGTGILLIKEREIKCQECYGKGGEIHYDQNGKYYVNSTGTIEQIQITAGNKNRVVYMLDIDGVRSGTLWRENQLFSSQEDAMLFCQRHNYDLG